MSSYMYMLSVSLITEICLFTLTHKWDYLTYTVLEFWKFVEEILTFSTWTYPIAFSNIQVHSMFNSNRNILRFLVEGWLLQNDTDVGGPTWTSGGPLGVCTCYRNAGLALQPYPQKPLQYSPNQQWPWFAVKIIILNSVQGLGISKHNSQQQKCSGQVYIFIFFKSYSSLI